MMPREQALKVCFDAFSAALMAKDVAAYRALAVSDAMPQEALFTHNAQKLAAQGLKVRLVELNLEGEVGEARFELLDGKGQVVDRGQVVFTEDGGRWRLRGM